VPIVPAAVLFDLWVGDARIRPDAAAGYAACDDALAAAAAGPDHPWRWGNVGAGSGASIGKLFGPQHAMKGGIGSASLSVRGVTVAALIAVNAVGDVIDPASGRLIAGARSDDGHSLRDIQACFIAGDLPAVRLPISRHGEHAPGAGSPPACAGPSPGANTTIGVIATDARLDKAQARRLAIQAHDGLARSIRPAHTVYDGDTLFALATGRSGAASLPAEVLGALAAEVTARAVINAVLCARGRPDFGLPSAHDLGRA
jgi:L-aminopeptidase/D-esterase-like protein